MPSGVLKPFFSIIIPTLNEQKYLPLLLGDLYKQSFKDFEVIHVDGQSDDQTVSEARSFRNDLNLQQLIVNKRNVSFQRNQGAKQAQGQWLIFMDADNRLQPSFLLGVKYYLETLQEKKEPIDVFTTFVHLSDDDTGEPLAHRTIDVLNLALKAGEKTEKPIVLGALIGMRRQVFAKVKFKSRAKVMEDCLLAEEAKRAGFAFRILTDPTYAYSLRRLRAKGVFKTAFSSLVMHFQRMLGDDFAKNDYGYQMDGGGAYE